MRPFCAGLPLPLLLRAAGLSHSCPTYSLNSRLPTVPLIPGTRACATLTMHQPSKRPAATATLPAPPTAQLSSSSTFSRFHICLLVSERGSRDIKTGRSALSPLHLPPATPCPILISPTPTLFNLLLTTWRGIASSSPPPPQGLT